MSTFVKRDADGAPKGCWGLIKVVAWTVAFALLLTYLNPLLAAELRFTNDDVDLVLLDTPCTNPTVMSLIVPTSHEFYQDGHATFPDRTIALCWRIAPNQQEVWVIDEEGDAARIPISVFAPKGTI